MISKSSTNHEKDRKKLKIGKICIELGNMGRAGDLDNILDDQGLRYLVFTQIQIIQKKMGGGNQLTKKIQSREGKQMKRENCSSSYKKGKKNLCSTIFLAHSSLLVVRSG